jgi:protein disulfide-isomerase
MKYLKSFFTLGLFAILPLGLFAASEATWSEDFVAAQKQAEAEKKPMLLLFTGSDWCGYCIKLEKSVLSSEEFTSYTNENYVLVKADFPRRKQQSETVKKQNQALARAYGIEGFPTVIVVSPDGKKVLDRSSGYGGQSPEAYVTNLKKFEDQS